MASIITLGVTARLDAVFKVLSALVKHNRYAIVTHCPRDGGQAEAFTKAARAPVNSPERQFQPPEKAARGGAGIDRARSGYRKHAARVLRSRHPTALVDPVCWLMFLSSKTIWVRQVVELLKSCSQRPPTMVRRSCRPSLASSAVSGTVGLEKPFGKRLTVAQPGAAVSAVLQPCWNGFVWN